MRSIADPSRGRKVLWSGDGNNVCASFLHAAGRFGFDLTFTGPETLDPDPKIVAWARREGADVRIERDPARAVEGADLVVTDTWLSMHDDEGARERRHNQLRPYQVNGALMAQAKPDALFMHCLPPTGTRRRPPRSWTGRIRSSSTRRRTGCMRRRRSCAGASPKAEANPTERRRSLAERLFFRCEELFRPFPGRDGARPRAFP